MTQRSSIAPSSPLLLPLTICLLVVAGSFALWNALLQSDRSNARARAEAFRNSLAADLESELGARRLAMERLARRWQVWKTPNHAGWQADSEHYLEDYPALDALMRIDANGAASWSLSRDPAADLPDVSVLEDLLESPGSRITAKPGENLFILVPLQAQEQQGGMLVASFDADQFLHIALGDHQKDGYGFELTGEQGQILIHDAGGRRHFASDGPVNIAGAHWRLSAWPGAAAMDRLLTPLPHLVLAAGLLLAIALFISAALAQSARRKRGEAEAAYRELDEQIGEHRRTTAWLEALLHGSRDAISVKDPQGRYQLINTSAARLLGLQAEQALGRSDAEILPPEEAERIAALDQAVLVSEETNVMEERHVVDGSQRITLTTRGVVRDPGGAVMGSYAISHDATERIQAREELAERTRLLAGIIDAQLEIGTGNLEPDEVRELAVNWAQQLTGADGAVVEDLRDGGTVCVAASGIATPYLGLSLGFKGTLSGLTVMTGQLQRCDDSEVDERVDRAVCKGMGVRSMLGVPLLHGDEVIAVLKVLWARPGAGNQRQEEALKLLSGLVAASLVKALAHQALTIAKRELERSNEDLQQFAYVASHDLQEPLRMVSSYTQLLERRYAEQLDDDAREFIHFAVDGAMRMQRLINDLLQLSRIGSRGRPFEATDCNEVLGRVRANLAGAMEDAGALLTHQELPVVMADSAQLVQLLQNLVANAIKFHEEGSPHVHVSATEQGEVWLFAVRDNGIGIEPQFYERIFTIFQRLHGKADYPGTGIGLAICKRIVQRHGGEIWVESAPGEGSIFYFTLPKNPGGNIHGQA